MNGEGLGSDGRFYHFAGPYDIGWVSAEGVSTLTVATLSSFQERGDSSRSPAEECRLGLAPTRSTSDAIERATSIGASITAKACMSVARSAATCIKDHPPRSA
jgi:hypothetical protein